MRTTNPSSRRPFRAFTLVELVFVTVILGILASIAAPRYSAFVSNQQIEGAARKISADLAYAQHLARRGSTSKTVSFNVAGGSYTLVGVEHPDHPSQVYSVKLAEEPYGARIISASFGGDANLVFNGFGTPDSSGTLVIAVGARQTTITVDSGLGKSKKGLTQIESVQLE